jgi:hypothetical protein
MSKGEWFCQVKEGGTSAKNDLVESLNSGLNNGSRNRRATFCQINGRENPQ